MREKFLKRFAIIFSTLLLLQQTHALIDTNKNADPKVASYVEEELQREAREVSTVPEEEEVTEASTGHSREKRVLGFVLMAIAGISGGFDVYKQQVGCKVETPQLQGLVDQLSVKQATTLRLKDQINLAWVPVVNYERLINRTDSDMNIIRNLINEIDVNQIELITLIDSKLITKFDQVKAQMENVVGFWNDTTYADPQSFNRPFLSKAEYAFNLASKFGSVGLYLGGKFLLPKITARVTAAYARNLASTNPALITKFINNVATVKGRIGAWAIDKYISFRMLMDYLWTSFKARLPSTPRALQGIRNAIGQRLTQAREFFQRNRVIIGRIAGGIVIVIYLIYEIWKLVQFNRQCQKNVLHVQDMHRRMDNNIRNMTTTLGQINTLANNYKIHYGYMKSNFTNSAFLNFTKDVIRLGENAYLQTDPLKMGVDKLKQYNREILAADDFQFERLNKVLISGLSNINYKLVCLFSKLNIVAALIRNCARGTNHFDQLYIDAKADEKKKVTDQCIAGNYMNKPEMKNITEEAMMARKVQKICIRNSVNERIKISKEWYANKTVDAIVLIYPTLTRADIEYFLSVTPPGPVEAPQVTGICAKKSERQSPTVVGNIYNRFNQTQVAQTFANCRLSKANVEDICTMKNALYKVVNVTQKYQYYSFKEVNATYYSCPKVVKVSPADSQQMCSMYGLGFTYTKYPPLWATYMKKYGKQVIDQHLAATCPTPAPAGDSPMYHKIKKLAEDIEKEEEGSERRKELLKHFDEFFRK